MKEIEINEIPKYIEAAPKEMPLMFIGDTGIGKTQVISEYAKKKGYYFKSLVLSQLRADEALGIPIRTKRVFQGREMDVLTTATPEWVFELAEQEKAMLFLDEFLCTKPDVMNSFLNFLTERKVNGIDLSHVLIVTATNIGKYTYEPDNNILSRFCMFYTVNRTYNEFINDKRIRNNYVDKTPKNHVVFDERSLKPRCHYWLSLIKDDELLPDFYEGFTNMSMEQFFSPNADINRFLNTLYRNQDSDSKYLIINEGNVGLFVQFIKKRFPRIRDCKNMCAKMKNVVWEINDHVNYINYRIKK